MKIRFGEIKIGDTFNAFSFEMVKIDEYNARTTSSRGKQYFLFQKSNLVEIPNIENFPWYAPAGFDRGVLVGYKGKVTFNEPIINCPYVPKLIPLTASDGTIFYLDKINS